ncbi:MAG TPA: FHA domain-containing protein, partial [Polyangiaceae bacterium]|nr:FHA domain-containing protein [Polyangiaceae bacterium]
MWLLTIEDDEGLTTYHRLSGERCSLGRTPDNDVVLAQLNISRRHARLERHGGMLFVRDEGSRAGSFLNGQRVRKPTPVADGDALQLGDYVVRFSRELSALDL